MYHLRGGYIVSIARSAVPCFCVISGYFYDYRKGANIPKYLRLILFSCILFGVWNYVVDYRDNGIAYYIYELVNAKTLIDFFFVNTHKISYHLWYLPAMLWTNFLVYIMFKVEKIRLVLLEKYKLVAGMLLVVLLIINAVDYLLGRSYSSFPIYAMVLIETTPYFLIGFCLKRIQIKHSRLILLLSFIGNIAEAAIWIAYNSSTRGSYMFTPLLTISAFVVFRDMEFQPKQWVKRVLSTSALVYIVHPIVIGCLVWIGNRMNIISRINNYLMPMLVYGISIVLCLSTVTVQRRIANKVKKLSVKFSNRKGI